MARVRVTEQARNELHAILAYYERVGAVEYAEVFEERLLTYLKRLEQFPRSGRTVPEIEDESIREIIYRSYRIVYVLDANENVDVLTVFHSSRQFGTL